MKRLVALTALAFLAACGADGVPQAPAASPPPPGLTLSGDAYIGVVSN
jgi:predicted small lipoprotein YifL